MSRVVAVALLAGCAGSQSAGPVIRPDAQTTIDVGSGAGPLDGQAGLMTITRADVSATDSLDVPAARAFHGLHAAYEAIGVPVTLSDPGAGRVGNAKLVMRQRLVRTPLSRYLQCGETLTGSRADTDRVIMSIVSTVTPRPGGTSSIRTTLAARAFDMSGSSGNPQTCSSTGVLEALVNARANTLASAR